MMGDGSRLLDHLPPFWRGVVVGGMQSVVLVSAALWVVVMVNDVVPEAWRFLDLAMRTRLVEFAFMTLVGPVTTGLVAAWIDNWRARSRCG